MEPFVTTASPLFHPWLSPNSRNWICYIGAGSPSDRKKSRWPEKFVFCCWGENQSFPFFLFFPPISSWLNYQRADSRRCEFGGRRERIPVWNLGMRLLVREEEEDEMGEANFLGRKQRRRVFKFGKGRKSFRTRKAGKRGGGGGGPRWRMALADMCVEYCSI